MSTAATPKGERRRQALVDAAADLLVEGGFDAVRHRSVATRADLPLASTTYYFESLDDLIAAAVDRIGSRELDTMRGQVTRLSHRTRGDEATAELLVDLLVGPYFDHEDHERLVARLEWLVASARRDELQEVQGRLRSQLGDIVAEALQRSDRDARGRLRKLLAIVDGAVMSALSDHATDVRGFTRSVLVDVIGLLAPENAPLDNGRPRGLTVVPEVDRRSP
ncbi:TetR family transcriptional regulator [Rhodococcus sp. HNM0569]|uniref:TetR family transcriptional regulator n=1 Tax=Rhodococcus sp. HNM0569 TaxID=2716340 RepID=UPI00146BA9FC|nr:TetR family transcriptional regulator [Rhodococcus sp. HNM0569]